jgi:hypothetical protein
MLFDIGKSKRPQMSEQAPVKTACSMQSDETQNACQNSCQIVKTAAEKDRQVVKNDTKTGHIFTFCLSNTAKKRPTPTPKRTGARNDPPKNSDRFPEQKVIC